MLAMHQRTWIWTQQLYIIVPALLFICLVLYLRQFFALEYISAAKFIEKVNAKKIAIFYAQYS